MWNCEDCLRLSRSLSRKCTRFSKEYIDSYIYYEKDDTKKEKPIQENMTLARLERKKKSKKDRENLLALERSQRSGEVILKNVDEDTIVFELDGYKHKTCPVADINDIELMGIMSDTLYCIDVGMPPNEGNAYDQSYLYRIAFTILSRERDAVKNEREKKHIEDAKKKSPSSGGSRGKKK